MLKARKKFRHDPVVIEAKAQKIVAKLRLYHAVGQPPAAAGDFSAVAARPSSRIWHQYGV